MPATRAQLDPILLRRLGKKFLLVGLDGVTADGSNPDLIDPLTAGMNSLGISPATVGTVADADLLAVPATQLPQLLDVAELRGLETVLGNWDEPDQMADTDNSQSLGKLYDSLEKTVARKQALIQRLYGIGLGTLTAGVLDLGFAETLDFGTGLPH